LRPVLRLVRRPGPDAGVDPAHDVATYIEQLQNEVSAPSVNQQLAAVRMLLTGW
jgi:hypothetical protein